MPAMRGSQHGWCMSYVQVMHSIWLGVLCMGKVVLSGSKR